MTREVELFALLFDETLSLGSLVQHLLTPLDLLDILISFGEFNQPTPEGLHESRDLLNTLSLDDILYGFSVVASILLAADDEVIELLTGPRSEPCSHQLLDFYALIGCETPLIHFLGVILLLLLFGVTSELLDEFLLRHIILLLL